MNLAKWLVFQYMLQTDCINYSLLAQANHLSTIPTEIQLLFGSFGADTVNEFNSNFE